MGFHKIIEVKFRRGGKKKFALILKKGLFGGEKWIVAELGRFGTGKKIGEAKSTDDALQIIVLKYGDIKDIKIK